ncbi:MAG TPA: PDZ domain-containing protein, partial [Rhizomicrobium sp.]|nr:PDZ domain-containing protein [Rhizomicrobium sp.]
TASVKNQVFIVFPLEQLSDIEGVPLPGMVGYETFRRFVTRVDYGAHTLTLIDPKHFDPKDAGTPVKFVFNEHVPEVRGTFEGLPAKFDIDTGSRAELTITKPFAETNNLRAKHAKGVDAVDGWGVGGPSHAYVTRGAEMSLGDVKVAGIVTSLSTDAKGAFAGSDYSGNVGAGILKRFVVTFDYNNQVMYLKPLPQPVADTGTFDRAGMWFNQTGTGFKIVDVTQRAPAEEAGLKAGDEIVEVDGKPADAMKLYDLRFRLRNDAPGTVVTFKVLRGKEYRTIKVTLRDLI